MRAPSLTAPSPDRLAPERLLPVLRVLVGGYVIVWILVGWGTASGLATPPAAGFRPIGVVSLVLDTPLPQAVSTALALVGLGSAAAVVAGWRLRWAAPVLALAVLWIATYRSSWGQVFHTDNLLVLHTVALALAADAASGRPPSSGRRWGLAAPEALWVLRVVTVATYVLAGVAKLRNSGFEWVTGDHLRSWVAYDNLRKVELGDVHSPLGGWLVGRSGFWPLLAAGTVLVEVGAPVALLGPRWARAWAAAAWLFHVGVALVMAILFPFALTGIAFVPFLASRAGEAPSS